MISIFSAFNQHAYNYAAMQGASPAEAARAAQDVALRQESSADDVTISKEAQAKLAAEVEHAAAITQKINAIKAKPEAMRTPEEKALLKKESLRIHPLETFNPEAFPKAAVLQLADRQYIQNLLLKNQADAQKIQLNSK